MLRHTTAWDQDSYFDFECFKVIKYLQEEKKPDDPIETELGEEESRQQWSNPIGKEKC